MFFSSVIFFTISGDEYRIKKIPCFVESITLPLNNLLLYDPLCIPKKGGDFLFIDPASIIYVEANNKYSNIYCINNVTYLTVSLTLQEVYSRLPRRIFYRVHKSYIVSRSYMRGMNGKKTSIFCVNNININIGRAYQMDFLKRFKM